LIFQREEPLRSGDLDDKQHQGFVRDLIPDKSSKEGLSPQTSGHQRSQDSLTSVPKLYSPATLSPTKLSFRNATNFRQAMRNENDLQFKKSQTMPTTTLEPLPIVKKPKFMTRKDVEATPDELQADPFIKIAERISKLPEVKNAWMRKKEAMQ
jgi:hypothetical protein